ncbi:hypothetical protein [Mesorhizobium sp. IMUNJ 23232]|uniref:hypothetical protein n=1 Tax=Mesorhizobium sp. IMUNJ 23232 TaxID=3376064 RepID=UPI00378ECEC2
MPRPQTPAGDRDAIQKGLTGDKIQGFDPAAAPLETDAEAAGTAQPVDPVRPALAEVEQPNASSHDTAMRGFEAKPQQSGFTGTLWVMLAFALVAFLVVLGFALFGG